MMQRKVTKGREALCGKLEDIQKGQVGLAPALSASSPMRRLTRPVPLCVWLELEADSWVAAWMGGR